MVISKDIISWAKHQGWEAIPFKYDCPEYDKLHYKLNSEDIKMFIYEHTELNDWWEGHMIPHSGGIEELLPEEVVKCYNNNEKLPLKY